MESIHKNDEWSLTDLPLGKIPIHTKLVYRLKEGPLKQAFKFKAWIVAKGYE
jgi:hypothetical protein